MADGKGWHLAQVKPNAYRLAERNLKRQGFSVFNPLHDVTRKERDRFVTRAVPLFPGYLFVSFGSDAGAHRKVNATLGISRLVSFGDRPSQVPVQIVDALRSRCDWQGRVTEEMEVELGDRIRFLAGPFADFIATVETIEQDQRIWVLIELLGRQTRISVPRGVWHRA